jgi:uncharacterized protein (TIGR03437 family)
MEVTTRETEAAIQPESMLPTRGRRRHYVLRHSLVGAGVACLMIAGAIRPGSPPRPGRALDTSVSPSRADGLPPRAHVKELYSRLPLSFQAVPSQGGTQASFLARGSGYSLALSPARATLTLHRNEGRKRTLEGRQVAAAPPARLQMKLLGANPQPRVRPRGELPGRSHYFIGNDPQQWQTDVPHYARVEYEGVYPGINLIWYGRQQELEYDLIVAPGADPRVIRLGYSGAEKVEINDAGDLVLHTAGGEVVQRAPVIYQESGQKSGQESERDRRMVTGRYVLRAAREVGFEVGAYDRAQPLVIDPVLSYATYLGEESDSGDVATDAAGNAYVVGTTSSLTFPTRNPAQATTSGGRDVFVTKLDPTGLPVYSTYLGGGKDENSFSIAVDADGNAYLTGSTASDNFPTVSAFQNRLRGQENVFVAKLNAAGNALAYSTYIGGDGSHLGFDIAVDAARNTYLTGWTFKPTIGTSGEFPVTPGAFKTRVGEFDFGEGFVAKLNAAGNALVYATYLGGGGGDYGWGIAVDGAGNAFVTGETSSTDFPTTPGATQMASSGSNEVFVTKLNPAGSALVYSTYFGGGGSESGRAIKVDADGNVYVSGRTNSRNLPTTSGAAQSAYGGGLSDGFLLKLSPTGARLYSTYLGGGGQDSIYTLALDNTGNIHAAGYSTSSDFPTLNALQPARADGGVFRSDNSGAAWSGGSSGLLSSDIAALVIDPATPSTIYAGSDAGVFKSTDSGQTWTASNTGLTARQVRALAIDPVTPGTVYAGTNAGMFKSANGGNSWSEINIGLGQAPTRVVTIDPTTPATLYVAPESGGAFKSTNGGSTWSAINLGPNAGTVESLAIDPTTSTTIYAGAFRNVYKSIDGGASWSRIAINPGSSSFLSVTALMIDRDSPATIYAGTDREGVFRSSNSGATWSAVNVGLTSLVVSALAATSQTPPALYAGTVAGVFKSVNGGSSWSPMRTGMAPDRVQTLAITPGVAGAIYVGTFGGDAIVARFAASGSLVNSTYFGGVSSDYAGGIAVSPAGTIYLSGVTGSTNFPITAGAFQGMVGSGGSAFIAKISESFTCALTCSASAPASATAGLPVAFTSSSSPAGCGGATTHVWDFGDSTRRVFQAQPTHVYLSAGTYTWRVAAVSDGAAACTQTGTVAVTGRGVISVSAASYSEEGQAPEAILSAFGTNLATTSQAAASIPPPTSLGGTTVSVRDSAGVERPAPLFFVSPLQVNYLVPSGTALGSATVTITSGDGTVSLGTAQITGVAPGLFAANASGQGVAAALVQRIKADGTRLYEEIVTRDAATSRFVARPIDLGPPGERVFLELYGTGLRFRSAPSNVQVKAGGESLAVSYAGAAPGYVGLDQVNVELPRSLIGRGEVEVVLTADGRAANTVRISVK